MRNMQTAIVIALFLVASLVGAGEQVIYVHAGRVIDVVEGRILEDQGIVIRGERIDQIGPRSRTPAPDGAERIDLSRATVLPGLIDAHVHLTKTARLQGYETLRRSAIREALFGANAAKRTLLAGFTTVRNMGALMYGDVALRDAINDGDIPGPRMVVSGPQLGITGGHADNNLLGPEYGYRAGGIADGPWAVRRQVRENVKYGADVIKFCGTGGVLSRRTDVSAQQYTLEEMKALADEAHTLGLRVAVHAHGTEGIKTAIRAGVDSVEHASLLDDDAITLALEHGTTFVMDVYVSDFILDSSAETGILEESLAKERQVGKAQRESFHRAHEAGVPIAFGTDAGVYPHGDNGKQFAYMVRHGMSSMEAIQAATVTAAELLGWSGRVGSVSPGAYADLIAVRRSPLDDIRLLEDVGFVMKGGKVYLDELTADAARRGRGRAASQAISEARRD